MAFWKKKQDIDQGQVTDGNHPESAGRNVRKGKNPMKRWRLLVVALTTFIAVLGFTYGAISYTSTPSFCSTCHEMAPEHVTYQASAHNQIKCTQCHIKPGAKNLVLHKVESLKEVYYHVVGAPDPIVPTVTISNENCEQCHSRNRLITANGDLKVNHKGHIQEGIPCITCHRGVVHAKVAERGINDSSTYAAWTKDNAKKLMGEKYENPNMGTCIDCHEQVNQGKKPWKDKEYLLPKNNHEKKSVENEDSVDLQETAESQAGVLERELPDNKQKTILQAVSQQKTDVKLSMQCFTCHQSIKTPKNHDVNTWIVRHGDFAVKDLGTCFNCHKDSLWIKDLEKQDIRKLLTGTEKKVTYKQDLLTVSTESRSNYFCSICHAHSPANHQERYTWLTDRHRLHSATPEERKKCFVCHDNGKPDPKTRTAPSDVYCDFCHNGEFKAEHA